MALLSVSGWAHAQETQETEGDDDAGVPLPEEAAPEPTSYGARAKSRVDREVGSTVLNAAQAKRTAGALGEPARALTSVPGVARAGFDSGELIVWGSTDAETHSYIDGVELPMLFHPGGFRSALHPGLLDSLSITKGAPGAAFGRGLGAVIEVSTQKLDDPAAHAALDLSTLDVSGSLRAGTGPIRAAWGARLGYMDRLAKLVTQRAGNIVPIPEYADGFAKVQLALDDHAQISAVWLGTHDSWQRGSIAVDPASSRTQTERRGLQVGYVRFERTYADRARVVITPFIESFDRGLISNSGSVPWALRSSELRYGVRASYTLPTPDFDLQLGVDGMATRTSIERAGTLTLPPREGDITVFGQAPGNELSRDDFDTYDINVAPYASMTLRCGRLTVTPGVRLDVYTLTSSRSLPKQVNAPAIGNATVEVRPEPRLALRYFASDWLSLGARAAITHQAAAAVDRSVIFGNPSLSLSKAMTVAGGPRLQPWRWLDLELVGFYKALSDLTTRNPALPLPLTAALVPQGSGSAFGGELALLVKPWESVSGQLSYTLSRSRRQDATGAERFFDYDQTHVLAFLWSARYEGWTLSGRARLATGSPRTQVVGNYRNLRDDRYEPIFGDHNELRLPTFFSLDLRLERGFTFSDSMGSVWVDVLNVTNNRNVEDIAYTFDYRAREDITGLPILAMLGVSAQL